MIGKEVGNKCLIQAMFPVLKKKVKMSTLTKFSAEDWKCILSDKDLTKGVWKNLLTWIKLNPKHEEHFPDLVRSSSSSHWYLWYDCILTNEDVVEAYLLGKKYAIDKWMSRCASAMSRSDGPLNLEQLQLEDLQKIVSIASGTCHLVKTLLRWSRLTEVTESLPLLVERLRRVEPDADRLLDEEDVALLKQVNAYDSLKSKITTETTTMTTSITMTAMIMTTTTIILPISTEDYSTLHYHFQFTNCVAFFS
jgi:hypothetical protein